MSSVDDRIVNMKFNNSQFGQGVDKTKRDLTGLEKTVTSVGKSKGMTDLGNSVEGVRVKFSALQVAGAAALGTIVSKATSAGISLVKKLTIQPLIDGFKEYQTNLESVQTIMANTGKSVGTVNKYLGELNKYSDQTIYNFSQMAKNIGTFTAAGVELDTATSAIKGISNLAALSGSNANQASTAMYQLSQAISAGKVGLQDWNSVVNAGMGGKVFKNALAQTAVAMGDLSAGAVKVGTDVEVMGQSFRQSISAAAGQESWLSSEVLVTTLAMLDGRFSETALKAEALAAGHSKVEAAAIAEAKMLKARNDLAKQGIEFSEKEYEAMVKKADAAYAAATEIKTATQLFQVVQESIGSMWANAFTIIMGDFEQSKELWGNVGDVVLGIIDNISGGFLGALRTWEERGGRMKVIDGLANIFGGLVDIFGAIAKGFDRAFPDSRVSLLNRLSKAFYSFSQNLVPSKETLQDIKTIAEAFFSIFHLGFTIVKGVMKGLSAFFGALFGATEGARGGVLSVVASIAEVIIAIEDWITSGSKITRFLTGIGTVAGTALSPIIATIGLVIDAIASLISGEGIGGAAEAFGRAREVFGEFVGGILTGLDQMTAPLDPIKSKIADFAMKVAAPFQVIIDKIEEVKDRIASGFSSGFEEAGAKIGTAGDKIKAFFTGFSVDSVPFERIGEALGNAADAVQEFVSNLDISDKIQATRDAVAGLWNDLFSGGGDGGGGGANAMAATAESTGSAFSALGDILGAIASGIGATVGFIKDAIGWIVEKLSNIPFPDDALEWASVLNFIIGGAIIKKLLFSKGVFGQLTETIKDIGNSVQDSFGQLTDTLKTMQGAIKSEIIKNIAIAVALLVASLIALSFIPQEKLANGLGALAATMLFAGTMMQILLRGMDDIKPKELAAKGTAMLAVGAAMVLMATAVAILSAAVLSLAFIPLDKLGTGLGAVGALMAMMTASLLVLSKNSAKIAASGAAMVLMATAIDILVVAVLALAFIPMEALEQGLMAVASGIAIMTAALIVLGKNSVSVLAAGGAMIMMATAMDMLVLSITTLGLLPWEVVKQGLEAVAWGVGIMVVALLMLTGMGPSVLASGGALLMLAISMNILMGVILGLGAAPWDVVSRGLGAMALGLLILVAAAGLATLVLPGMKALTVMIAAIGLAMLATGAGFLMFATGLALIAAVGTAAFAVITAAIAAFILLLPQIAIQMAAAFVTFIQAIAAASPKIRKAFGEIFKNMIGTVRDALPEIEALITDLIDTGINVIEHSIPRWVEMGFTIIDEFLNSAEEHVPNIVESATNLALFFIEEMGKNTVKFADAGMKVIIDTLNGLAAAVDENGPKIREAAWNLAEAFGRELRAAMGDILSAINPMNYLPDISVSDLRGLLPGGGDGRVASRGQTDPSSFEDDYFGMKGKGGKDKDKDKGPSKVIADLTKAVTDAATVIGNAIKLFVGADGGPLFNLVKGARDSRYAANRQSSRAEAIRGAADIATDNAQTALDNAQGMKKGEKGSKARAKRAKAIEAAKKAQKQARFLNKKAYEEEQKAIAAQQKSDFENQLANDSVQYKDDYAGLGAARAAMGSDLADRSSELAAFAQGKVDEAQRLEQQAAKGGKNAKKLLKEAAELRKQAAAETAQSLQLSAQAVEAQRQAVEAYAAARREAALDVITSMNDIRTRQEEEKKAREWQEAYDKADDATKITMLEDRKKENQKKLDAANGKLTEAYAASDALNARIAAGEAVSDADLAAVQKSLADAEKAAADASAASQAIDADTATIKQITDQIANQNTNGTGTALIPSRSVLEDAAQAVDRYSSSVAQAEEAAMAAGSTTQFVQNNYSPEALSASQIYRQTNNLISAAEVKMGV